MKAQPNLMKAFFAVVICLGSYVVHANELTINDNTDIKCPDGTKYKCMTGNGFESWKGDGVVVIEL
jgi:hypothetical protein